MITKGVVEVNTGANASAEADEGEEGVEDAPAQVNNVIDGFRLNAMPPYAKKKDFGKAIKGTYASKVLDKY